MENEKLGFFGQVSHFFPPKFIFFPSKSLIFPKWSDKPPMSRKDYLRRGIVDLLKSWNIYFENISLFSLHGRNLSKLLYTGMGDIDNKSIKKFKKFEIIIGLGSQTVGEG